jgi:hypothetical protein
MEMRSIRNVSAVVLLAFTAAGCYTQLMTPQEFVQTQRYQSKRTIADNSYSVNYNQSCVNCHSVNELNERYDELSQLGVMTVHNGISIHPSMWSNPTVEQPIILVPGPEPYWPGPYTPVNPWWAPPITTTGTNGTPAGTNGDRIRDNGPTRDGNRSGDRGTPISSPTYSQPPSSGNTTTTVPTAPAPTRDVTPSAPPAQTPSVDRSRDSNSSSGTTNTNRTRDNGSSRDDGGNRPR